MNGDAISNSSLIIPHSSFGADAALRGVLLAMAAEDEAVRAELAADGSLFDGYHPRMRAVHDRNAARLGTILDERGWPGRSLVGEDGAEAAWRAAQHAIAQPALMRRALALLWDAVARDEAPARQAAMMEDRVRTFEGRPQRYGTQFDWDEGGQMSPLPIEDEAGVEERRRAVGLEPLAGLVPRVRADVAASPEHRPGDPAARRAETEAWARSVGWREREQ